MSKPLIGLFAGSFDPFTIGHDDLVRRALGVVDELHILVGVNVGKRYDTAPDVRVQQIAELYRDEPRITVASTEGLTAHYARRVGATILIRGIRSVRDMEAEREMAETNLSHFGLDTLFFFTRPELAAISSHLVRELAHFGEDVTPYLPKRDDH
ncbi:pantetheine-phosphate adenylyltransferase [Porphyromonas sp. HMSC065F10]|uniref:pantetheine-phosphate adenylyltransferase n=1 Tax=Porphyromonas sp. HMSC065F10 TaxID=1739394 RepID=UPI0008A2E639|nr:pantetheine-phosphate adenylyltransferase [Porphyromonas sp. HMSC065F10]OFR33692.1 pantetheine-phosphate adenylyltransferase [Porphyromonas sp. HMSC065F10]